MKLNLGCGRIHLPDHLNVDLLGGEVRVDAEHLPFREGSFEEVFASHVLEHIPDLVGTMHELHRVLKPGGLLKVIVPLGLRCLYTPAHLHPFNLTSLKNFCLEESHTVSSLQSGSLFRMVKRRVTNWKLPFMWHIHKHVTGRFPSLWITWRNHLGRVKTRLPLGRRSEATFWLPKREVS